MGAHTSGCGTKPAVAFARPLLTGYCLAQQDAVLIIAQIRSLVKMCETLSRREGGRPVAERVGVTKAGQSSGASASSRPSVVDRAVVLLETVAAHGDGIGVRDAARQTGIDRSAVSRILAQFEQLGFAEQSGQRG